MALASAALLSESGFSGFGDFQDFVSPNPNMDKRLPLANARRKNPENPLIPQILILTKTRGFSFAVATRRLLDSRFRGNDGRWKPSAIIVPLTTSHCPLTTIYKPLRQPLYHPQREEGALGGEVGDVVRALAAQVERRLRGDDRRAQFRQFG